MKTLIVVDMQNDFITGALGSQDAEKIVPNVVELVKHFPGAFFLRVILTARTICKPRKGRNFRFRIA